MTACHEPVETTGQASSLNLTARRQKNGIALEQVEAATKIGLNFLRAIEAEDFKALPGGVYNTSYIRQYARAVSFDEDELVQHYQLATNPEPNPEPARALPGVHGLRSLLDLIRRPRRWQHTA